MGGPIIGLKGLSHRYPSGDGVGPIDLELGAGIHGLLGPNGSGKTTLIKTLLGFLEPTSGVGHVLGHDLVRDRLKIRSMIGYMAESDVLVPGLNPTQTVRLAAELCGMSAARAHEAASEALQAVGMGDERFHAPQRLSTGQRQRMKLASALVHAPHILFLDEPTNGLDPKGRRDMLDLIREISVEKQVSVILSTHILPDVESVCQDAILLREGKFVGVEQVSGRSVQKASSRTNWYAVEVLGDHEEFLGACHSAKMEAEVTPKGLRVAATGADRIISIANKTGTVLSGVKPATAGVQDAILAQMEGN